MLKRICLFRQRDAAMRMDGWMDGWGHTLRSGVRIHMDHEAARAIEPSVTDTAAVPAVVVRGALVRGQDICWEVHCGEALMRSV